MADFLFQLTDAGKNNYVVYAPGRFKSDLEKVTNGERLMPFSPVFG